MKYSRTEKIAMQCMKLANHNMKCYKILMELLDAGREDILSVLMKTMGDSYNGITPEQIVKTYDACGGKDGFLQRCKKIFNNRNLKKEHNQANYEYHLMQYNCGERKDHPDGSRFEDGKEINYD